MGLNIETLEEVFRSLKRWHAGRNGEVVDYPTTPHFGLGTGSNHVRLALKPHEKEPSRMVVILRHHPLLGSTCTNSDNSQSEPNSLVK
jgi:hypothetical protein